MRILLVEDNLRVAETFAEIIHTFTSETTEVSIAGRADDAIYQAMMFDWNLIIMDIGLSASSTPPIAGMVNVPGPPSAFDGTLTALAIRGLGGKRGEVPILAITGGMHATDTKLVEAARFAGGKPLMKPVMPDDLRAAIERFRR